MTGLNATLPISFSQIWSRIRVSIGAFRPPATNAAEIACAAFAALAAGLAEREARALDVADHPGLDDLRRAVEDAADHGLGGNGARDRRRRGRRSRAPSLRAAPPCDWKYHHGMPFWPAITAAPGLSAAPIRSREPRQAVRLEPDEDDVGLADRVDVVRGDGVRLEVAARAQHPDAVAAAAREVLAARDQRHVCSAARERRARRTRRSRRRRAPRTSFRRASFGQGRERRADPLALHLAGRRARDRVEHVHDLRHLERRRAARGSTRSARARRQCPFSATAAPTRSPYFSSSMPKQTASATAGWPSSTSSIS